MSAPEQPARVSAPKQPTRTSAPAAARPPAPGFLRATRAILGKDLLLERRGFELLPAMALLALGTLVLLHFALRRDSVSGDLAAGALLIPLLLAALLGITRVFVSEERDGGIDVLLLTPAPPGALLAAKVCGLWLALAALEIVLVPAFGLLLLGPSIFPALPGLILVLALLNAVIAVIGGLVAGLALGAATRELLVPILVMPLVMPGVIAAQRAIAPLLVAHGETLTVRWLAVLAIYAVVLALVGSVVGEYLVED